jgi:hypothetical protein
MRMIPMPSPAGTNRAGSYLPASFFGRARRPTMAFDAAMANGSSARRRLALLLGTLSEAEVEKVMRFIEPENGDDELGEFRNFLHGKGMSDDDVRSACDVARALARNRGFAGRDSGRTYEEMAGHEPCRDRSFGSDSAITRSFFDRFPSAARIGVNEHDDAAGRTAAPSSEPGCDRGRRLAADRAPTGFAARFPDAMRITNEWGH